MLYREIIAVCSQIHTKHINTLCGQNVGFVDIKLVVHIVTTAHQEGWNGRTARAGGTKITKLRFIRNCELKLAWL